MTNCTHGCSTASVPTLKGANAKMPVYTFRCFSLLVFSLIAKAQLGDTSTAPKRSMSKGKIDHLHLEAQYLDTQNKAKNKEHVKADSHDSRMTQRPLKHSSSEARYDRAAKAVFLVTQRAFCRASQNILDDVVNDCYVVKHSNVGQRLLPQSKTIERMGDALSPRVEASMKFERVRSAQRPDSLAISSHHRG